MVSCLALAYNRRWWEALWVFILAFVIGAVVIAAKFLVAVKDNVSNILYEEKAPKVARWLTDSLDQWSSKIWWTITSRFRVRYCAAIVLKYRTYRTLGLKTRGRFTFDLKEVFVPLRVSPESPQRISSAMIHAEQRGSNLTIWNFLTTQSRDNSYDKIVLIGAPGSGKTTLLEHLALTYAQGSQRRYHKKAPKLIPVLLSLRQISEQITVQAGPELIRVIEDQDFVKELRPRPEWFKQQLNRGKCLVMLDGLDEIGDAPKRTLVSNWVNKQIQAYPRCQFLVTSRPFGYQSAPIDEARIVTEVLNFNKKQVKHFIYNWYLQSEAMHQMRKIDKGVRETARQKAEDLIARIRSTSALRAMAVNPLLLTMIATVHDNRGVLPKNRVELYKEICEVLLGGRQDAKQIPVALTVSQKMSVLQVLALDLMLATKREFTLEEGVQSISGIFSTVAESPYSAKEFLLRIEKVSGLLVESELGSYRFAHKSFQEYLAANEIRDTKQISILSCNIRSDWWQETVRLFAAQGDATDIVIAALNDLSLYTLSLAVECVDDGGRVSPDVRGRLYDTVEFNLDSQDHAMARLAARVKLSQRLRKFQKLSPTVEVDTSLITCAEFQVFLDQQRENGYFLQPRHWHSLRFPDGSGRQPVLGVELHEARLFCRWASDTIASIDCTYRLPNRSEGESSQNFRDNGGFWYVDNKTSRGIIHPGFNEPELRKQLEQIINADLMVEGLDLSGLTERCCEQLKRLDVLTILDVNLGRARSVELDRPLTEPFHEADFFNRLRSLTHYEDQVLPHLPSPAIIKRRLHVINSVLTKALRVLDQVTDVQTVQHIFSISLDRQASRSDDRNLALSFLRYYALCSALYRSWLTDDYERIHAAISKNRNVTPSQLFLLSSQFELAFELYVYLTVQWERRTNNFRPWEGIRLVRAWSEE